MTLKIYSFALFLWVTKHDPPVSLSLGQTGCRTASKTNERILPPNPSCCRHRCGFQAGDEQDDNNNDDDDDGVNYDYI